MIDHRSVPRLGRIIVSIAGLSVCLTAGAGAAHASPDRGTTTTASPSITTPSSTVPAVAPPPTSIPAQATKSDNVVPVIPLAAITRPCLVPRKKPAPPPKKHPAIHHHATHRTHSTKTHKARTPRHAKVNRGLAADDNALLAFNKAFAANGIANVEPIAPLPVDRVHLGAADSVPVPLSLGTVGAAIALLALGLGVRLMTRHRRQRLASPAMAASGTTAAQSTNDAAAPGPDAPDATNDGPQHDTDA